MASEDYIIASVAKSLKTLKQFDVNNKELSLTQLSSKTGINKSSMLRILASLESEGFVKYDEERRKYRLGIALFNLGNTAFEFLDIKKVCTPYLKRAAVESQLLIHLAVIEDNRVIVIDKVWPTDHLDVIALVSYVGGSVPLHCTGVGKVLSAYSSERTLQKLVAHCEFEAHSANTNTSREQFLESLPKIREKGFAFNDCEHEPYLRCITRPIFNSDGKVIAAVSLSGLKDVMTDEKLGFYGEISKRTTREISREFGYRMN